MKRILFVILITLLLFSSCTMENMIPEQSATSSAFHENVDLYKKAVEEISHIPCECLISKTEYYRPDGLGDYVGIYIQNMEDNSVSSYDGEAAKVLLSSGVKLIDKIQKGDVTVISFSLCVPGRNYDFGYYYCSAGKPVYLGDPSIELTPEKNGYQYSKKGSLGMGATFYTEELTESFYYYEIR